MPASTWGTPVSPQGSLGVGNNILWKHLASRLLHGTEQPLIALVISDTAAAGSRANSTRDNPAPLCTRRTITWDCPGHPPACTAAAKLLQHPPAFPDLQLVWETVGWPPKGSPGRGNRGTEIAPTNIMPKSSGDVLAVDALYSHDLGPQ